ncbi:MAG: elongation factor G [Deltaproteobacteria bacterium]
MANDASRIRTVAVIGQGGVGKTSVADALVFAAGANTRLGRVDEETSVFDVEPEEIRHRTTMSLGLYDLAWNKHQVTVVDTPGQGNFVLETDSALRGVAGAIFVVDPSGPLRAESVKLWSWVQGSGIPCLVVINRLDRSEVDFDGTVAALKEMGMHPSLLQVAVGSGEELSGVASVSTGVAHVFDGDSGKYSSGEPPAEMAARLEELKEILTEDAAEGDDELLEKYLDTGQLSEEEVRRGITVAVATGTMNPVLCVSAGRNIGFSQLLDAIVELLPSPSSRPAEKAVVTGGDELEVAPSPEDPFSAVVFKTIVDQHAGKLSVFRVMSGTVSSDAHVVNTKTETKERLGHLLKLNGHKTRQVESATVGEIVAVAKLKNTHAGDTLADPRRELLLPGLTRFAPVIAFALEAAKRGEEDKVMQGLLRLAEEDTALHVERGDGSGDILLSGAGQLHVEVACEKLQRKYGVAVILKAPKVPYRETLRKSVRAHGRLKKQTGGHGQFADCRIEVVPLARGEGFEFVNKIVGGSIPRGFIPAVKRGVVEAMRSGNLAGYPVVDVRVTLYDGQYHDVDSSEMAFKVAGSMAFRSAMEDAKPSLLEPYVSLEVAVPDECMGDVMGDLNSRRAKVEGMEQQGHNQAIRAKVPMAEVLRYAPDLTSMTSGRGSFEILFSHYEPLPDHLVAKVVGEVQAREKSD